MNFLLNKMHVVGCTHRQAFKVCLQPPSAALLLQTGILLLPCLLIQVSTNNTSIKYNPNYHKTFDST